jgi:hypothetical protein
MATEIARWIHSPDSETLSGEFALDGTECFIELEIPTKYIHKLTIPPYSKDSVVIKGVVRAFAVRIEWCQYANSIIPITEKVLNPKNQSWSESIRQSGWSGWSFPQHSPPMDMLNEWSRWSAPIPMIDPSEVCTKRGHHDFNHGFACQDCAITAKEAMRDVARLNCYPQHTVSPTTNMCTKCGRTKEDILKNGG